MLVATDAVIHKAVSICELLRARLPARSTLTSIVSLRPTTVGGGGCVDDGVSGAAAAAAADAEPAPGIIVTLAINLSARAGEPGYLPGVRVPAGGDGAPAGGDGG